MLEIMIMYGAVVVIFVTSLVLGFIKSTRAVLILGGLVTAVAITCGIHLRKYELLDTVLEYVKTNGKSVFSTPSEWDRMQLLGVGVIVAIIVLGAVCFVVDAAKESKTSVVFLVAVISFMASFHLSDKRDIVASWNDVSSDVVSSQELYHMRDDDSGIEYEIGVFNADRKLDWYSISNPIDYKLIDSNWDWRVTKNGVKAEMNNVWKTRVRYTDIETDNVSPFMTWLRTNDIKLKMTKITRTGMKVVRSNKYYPDITQTFTRYIMDVQLEPDNPNWRTEFENWKATVNELNQITKPKSSTEN
jgi:hypothetical protein